MKSRIQLKYSITLLILAAFAFVVGTFLRVNGQVSISTILIIIGLVLFIGFIYAKIHNYRISSKDRKRKTVSQEEQ